jgi:hypothetical protein
MRVRRRIRASSGGRGSFPNPVGPRRSACKQVEGMTNGLQRSQVYIPTLPPRTSRGDSTPGTPGGHHFTGGTGGKTVLMITTPGTVRGPGAAQGRRSATAHDPRIFRKGQTRGYQAIRRKAHILGGSRERRSLRSDILGIRTKP